MTDNRAERRRLERAVGYRGKKSKRNGRARAKAQLDPRFRVSERVPEPEAEFKFDGVTYRTTER